MLGEVCALQTRGMRNLKALLTQPLSLPECNPYPGYFPVQDYLSPQMFRRWMKFNSAPLSGPCPSKSPCSLGLAAAACSLLPLVSRELAKEAFPPRLSCQRNCTPGLILHSVEIRLYTGQ